MQHNENANPPTFFLTLDTLLSLMEKQGEMVSLVRKIPEIPVLCGVVQPRKNSDKMFSVR